MSMEEERYLKTDIRQLPASLVWSWGNRGSFIAFLLRRLLPVPWYGPVLAPAVPTFRALTEGDSDALLVDSLQEPAHLTRTQNREDLMVYTPATAPGLLLELQGRSVAYYTQLGLCVPATAEDVRIARARLGSQRF